ncbi:MAG: hypothetical protein QNJ17_09785 [Desulfocapsaceae bacterium]|nr:hypothetical protein [Desulfocapsaceae bacterium]
MKSSNGKKHERIVVICAYCQKSLQGQELWERDSQETAEMAKATISHGICPDCLLEHFPNEYLIIQEERRVRIKKLFEEGFKNFYGHLAK